MYSFVMNGRTYSAGSRVFVIFQLEIVVLYGFTSDEWLQRRRKLRYNYFNESVFVVYFFFILKKTKKNERQKTQRFYDVPKFIR